MSDVSNAISNIQDNLKDGWRDSVTRGELQENNTILENLSRVETNDVVEGLSNANLDKWTDEIYDGKALGIFGSGGLSADERTDLYDNLARDLEPEQLQRVYNALGDESRQTEFINSVSTHASDSKKAELVALLASTTTDKPSTHNAGFGSSTTKHWDQDANAVSTLIGSMTSTRAIESAIDGLSDPQLQAVMSAGVQDTSFRSSFSGSAATSHSFNTTGITNLLEAAGRSNDTALKARVFELASRQIDEIRSTDVFILSPNSVGGPAGDVANALSDLLATDTTGIITALEAGTGTDGSSRAGNGLSSYMAELVRQNDIGQITDLIAKLQSGNQLNQDPADFLSVFSVDERDNRNYQNASNLGFLVGAVREGIGAIESDRQQQAEIVSTIFGTALGLGRIPLQNAGAKAAGIIAGPLSKELINGVTSDLASGDRALDNAIEALALPPEITSSDVTNTFNAGVAQVIRN